MRFVRQFLTIVVVYALSGAAVNAVRDNEWLTLVLGLASAALIVLVYAWVVRRTEHRPATDVARKGAASRTAWGILIGGGMFTAVIVNLYTSGHYDIDGLGSVTGAVGLLGFMAAAAATEEVVYRGVLFRIVEEHIGTYAAMGLTGVVFGLSHLFNENATLWGALAIAIEAGFMLAAVYAATRSLWLAIGVHFGWNFAAAGVFSTEVSGNGASEGLLDATTSGPELLTGGAFGPEGSVYSVGFGVMLTLVFLWLAHRRGNVVPFGARRAARRDSATTLPQ
ncbi:CPBP family intramembrane metalloprotease [Streptomyces sp. SID7958]|uniref:CPBP family intramembrane metalloprotease n=2 Tax=unclassified Streptomyces TaxID=2593676 RepID=A0A6G3R0T2_9ACTN|nr:MULTISPECIES: type II CAAX endopeptidase family protein [unclassified Streptomyces]NEA89040.1 CPBP family intramembrane metalloprotease [Streptomyces sp. SID14436]NEC82438.1 CPBP family intramembrane metalloprotease [Streptomyces sp. SID7958]